MPAATYGTENPAGTDPWAIESTLAPLATGGSAATAAMMLADYRAQREADTSNYHTAMDQQHAFAQQQLAQQLAEAKMKLFPEMIEKAGGAQFLAEGGVSGMNAMGPGGQQALTNLAVNANRAQGAKDFEHTGQGVRGFSEGGMTFNNAQQIPGLQGMDVTAGDNPRIAAEKIRQATSLARAKMGGGGRGGSESLTLLLDPSDATGNLPATYRPPKGQGAEATVQNLRDRGFIKTPVPAPDSGSHGTPAPTGGATRLQPAPGTNKSTSAARGGGSAAVDDANVRQLANTHLENVVRTQSKPAYDDIKANAQRHGGQVQIFKDAQGRYRYQGVQGQY